MSRRPPTPRTLRTMRLQTLLTGSRAVILCQTSAAGAADLARARAAAVGAGAPGAVLAGASTWRAASGGGWAGPAAAGTLFLVAVAVLDGAPAVWRALGGLPRVAPTALLTPDRWWSAAEMTHWGNCRPDAREGLLKTCIGPLAGPLHLAGAPARRLRDILPAGGVALLRVLRAHSSAG